MVKSINELTDEESLRELATPSNFRLGKEIFESGGVEIVEQSKYRVTAKVQPRGGQRRNVVLTATEQGLRCGCT